MNRFPGLRAEEKVLFSIRKHWAAFLGTLFKLFINLVIISLIAYYIVDQFPHNSISYFIFLELLIFYLLGSWWFFFNGWLDEELDTIVITSERIIDTTQSAFISMEIASADLDEIQDVKGRVAGFLGGIFRFGDLSIQTASAKNVFFMDHVRNPESYIDTLIEMKNEYIDRKNGR
ncbi:MAG: hypothetical protein K9L85_02710 [Candidatus Peribacteraceae bacterium]|nr:hypothetical protein [Candidatus Peribacteraceae bacterium]